MTVPVTLFTAVLIAIVLLWAALFVLIHYVLALRRKLHEVMDHLARLGLPIDDESEPDGDDADALEIAEETGDSRIVSLAERRRVT